MAAVRRRAIAKAESATPGKKNKALLVLLLSTLLLVCAVITVVCDRKPTRYTTTTRLADHIPEPPYAAEREIQWESHCRSKNADEESGAPQLQPGGGEAVGEAPAAPARKFSPSGAADSTVTWDALYPVWIDEEGEPRCPSLPEPRVPPGQRFDLVAVKLPCRKDGNTSWSRDVGRLHLQLSAAKLAVSASSEVLIVSECLPLPNLFPCNRVDAELELLGSARARKGSAGPWLGPEG